MNLHQNLPESPAATNYSTCKKPDCRSPGRVRQSYSATLPGSQSQKQDCEHWQVAEKSQKPIKCSLFGCDTNLSCINEASQLQLKELL